TTKPVFIYQGIGGSSTQANQDLFFVPPLSCENEGNVDNIAFIDQVDNSGETFEGGITIVTNVDASVAINGVDISNINNVQGPLNVTGNANYVTYKVLGLTENISVSSDKELYCAYFNRNGAATTGAFYSGFPSSPEISFEPIVASLGNCLPNVTLKISNDTGLFDYIWEYFNELTATWEQRGNKNQSYKPIISEPGKYRLIATIKCTKTVLPPFEVPVSLCPDDFDGDLIIDNLDIDIDNDGILNIDESKGDANLNLSNTTNPIIVFNDNTT
ncbi:gliding motility protein, partial [Polaribacter sp. BAL334]|nr:gliding motility protein [Polaribacter sp. BAL334]